MAIPSASPSSHPSSQRDSSQYGNGGKRRLASPPSPRTTISDLSESMHSMSSHSSHSDSTWSSLSYSSHHPNNNGNNRSRSNSPSGNVHNNENASSGAFVHSYKKPVMPPKSQYVAMDCEMVGTILGSSVCARVVLVDWKGRTLLDTYVKPEQPVTDYRTYISGIEPTHLVDAPALEQVRQQVLELLAGNILVGHGLENDLASLQIDHPWWMIRDTAYYQPFMQVRDTENGPCYVPRKLKDLCQSKLQRSIQTPGQPHSPAEDATAALDLYKSHRPRWETCMVGEVQKAHVQHQRQQRQLQQAHLQQIHMQQQQRQHVYHSYYPATTSSVVFEPIQYY